MQTEEIQAKNTRLALIGKFNFLHDEEYIARSFEMIGCEVLRVNEKIDTNEMKQIIDSYKPHLVLWTKLAVKQPTKIQEHCKKYKTACWVFDLYWGYYAREYKLSNHPAFKADFIFTTDGGHQKEFEKLGVNHHCVRQGIYKDECELLPFKEIEHEIVFVGSDNTAYPSRGQMVLELKAKWFGKVGTKQIRGMELNELYSKSRIVIGDSYPSPYYWSNRVVETLGRGGFLIHKEVEGLKEEYPYLITYRDIQDLKDKIRYYKENEEERQDIIKKNFEYVRDNYTCDKKCKKILDYVKIQPV